VACPLRTTDLNTWPNQRRWDLPHRRTDSTFRVSTNFTAAHFTAKSHRVNSSQKSHRCRLHLRWHSFSHCARSMEIGEGLNKDRFETYNLAVCENSSCRTARFLYQPVFHPYSTFRYRGIPPEVLETLALLKCTSSANFHSRSPTCSCKPIKCMLKTLFRGCKQ